ncbi:hypothetical protein S100390_v1c07650 [Spiroplasma sp. NBRC 100390]|uniref:lipoprotein n=1 Tax=unclassified Spiroplasma TaxID=2637901 RepID=UPI000892A045|nr:MULTISPECIES: lipoprotein [unclassified Spiroplasma]AOX44101.1 hypothetical protein STU14_v1c07650 [Spiroplasma sp. TU-14]APE13571.1 hypothetical protein S100390_v1c07650 [Spiroplasma sp. NBRC 100390]
MKRLLSILGMTMLTASSVIPVISCVEPAQKELTIHDQIKKSLQNTISFDDDWITDYSQPTDKIQGWSRTMYSKYWTFFNKLISDLVLQQLLKDIPDLIKHYPDFSFSAVVSFSDRSQLESAIQKNEKVAFNYDVSYNLKQLEDIPFQDLLDNNNLSANVKTGIIRFYEGSTFGQYKIKGKNIQNYILFNQKKFINDDRKRINYLAKMLNNTTAIKTFNGNYRKFLMMSPYIPSVTFRETDFSSKNLVKEIHNNDIIFDQNKTIILKNLKNNFIEDNIIKNIFNYMPIVFDDFDIDVSLVKAVLTSEIKADAAMNYVYGSDSRTYHNDMLIVNVKTTLKMGDILSDVTIDEQLALDISYV